MSDYHQPNATYRLQLNKELDFYRVAELAGYFQRLGVTDLYLSPIMQANPGSDHGYDMVDPTRINDELGGEDGLAKLANEAHDKGLRLLVDIVPNHMSASDHNPYWVDVKQKGQDSPYSYLFDIDWQATETSGDLKYRRFFDINELVCLRMEDEAVFRFVHDNLLNWVDRGWIDGLRIDHIDGLLQPGRYLRRLQQAITERTGSQGFYVIVEKILAQNERLPTEWASEGTTGYDFMNSANALFVPYKGYARLKRTFEELTVYSYSWLQARERNNRYVIDHLFDSEFDSLARLWFETIDSGYDFHLIDRAIRQLSAAMPCYRFYAGDLDDTFSHYELHMLDWARALSCRQNPEFTEAIAHITDILKTLNEAPSEKLLRWVQRWQQMTGPVMAKGFEDTASYQYNVLMSLNEVGSDPHYEPLLGDSRALHDFLASRYYQCPQTLNATSTHDTILSEDARMRLNVLSELANQFDGHVQKWRELNSSYRYHYEGEDFPDANTELRMYQSLLAVWPLSDDGANDFKERVHQYITKMAREAKLYTNWKDPDHTYENILQEFSARIMDPSASPAFMQDFVEFQSLLAFYGMINSLGLVLVKCLAPGVPDIYQGNERWRFDLVDPDNRRPVDFESRQSSISEDIETLKYNWTTGEIKHWLTERLLNCRCRHVKLVKEGQYAPIELSHELAPYLFAFARFNDEQYMVAVIARNTANLTHERKVWPCGSEVWQKHVLDLPVDWPDKWHNGLTGEVIERNDGQLALAEVLAKLPVAVLVA